jgi:hypothetical protein
MKKIIIVLFATIIAFTATAQNNYTTTYNDTRFTKDGILPTFTLYTENAFTKDSKVGYNMFVLVTKGWAEAYPGIFYKITGKDVVGVSIGMESATPYWRLAGSYIHFGDAKGTFAKRLFVRAFVEQGGGQDNYWYHVSVDYQTKNWRVGPMSRRFYGTGVRAEYQKADTKLKISVAGLYDTEVNQWKPTVFIGWDF